MLSTEFRMYFDGRAATLDELDRIETITVEQEMDAAWEARIELSICTEDSGAWSGQDEEFMRGFARVRLEIRVGDGDFVALIDGPVVGDDTRLDARPGQSTIILLVHDDSVYLNREEGVERFENLTDSAIARQVFENYDVIAETQIEDVPAAPDPRPPEVVRRGTHMDLLRELAERNDLHAYVLPGTEPGASRGVFAATPTEPDGLPDLVLTGTSRNLESFEHRRDEQRAATVVGATLSLSTKGVTARQSAFADVALLGDEQAFETAASAAFRRLPPGFGEAVDLSHRVNAEARRLSYGFEASATVKSGGYEGVLTPYRVVTVRGIDAAHNGDYLITQVTHTLNRSEYTQALRLTRNARTAVSSGSSIPSEVL